LGREARPRRVVHGTVDVTSGKTSSSSLLHADLVALGNLALKLLTADFTALSERNIERLGANHLVVHLSDSLGSLVGSREADESKALGSALLVTHDLAAGDAAEDLELSTELVVINIVLQVLDVQVDALVLAQLLHLGLLVRAAKFLLTLRLLLCPRHEQLATVDVAVMKGVDSLLGLVVVLEVDEPETLALALIINGDESRGDVTELGEELLEVLLGELGVNVLDVEVGELGFHLIELGLTLLAGDVVADVDLFVIEQHAVDGLDGVVSSLASLVMDEAVSFGAAMLIGGDLAG
jgi:hypothetical protein